MGEAGKWATMLDGLFSGDTLFFSVPAVAGTIFFVLRLALSFTGVRHIAAVRDRRRRPHGLAPDVAAQTRL